ncbi:hypothetical protein [Spirosoma rhododendri]|uniref:Viral A-type inclusion protein n=1 Tax=Spirosoma rhododendri TaxID=2728024 RepID=A0A7L5DFS3_9BACT|nr:hypothetical protein [Spirosoma rhododendri]QJD76989.1 hypothetical protein HH216_00100 [Spirosoma rhododendri]
MKLTRNTLFSLSLLVAVSFACGSKKEDAKTEETATTADPVKQLEEQVMAQHDSSMNLMGDIAKLKKQVNAKAAGAATGKVLVDSLTTADDAMMNWMNQYNGDTLGKLDQAKALEYLNSQKKSIDAVQMRMKKSIADASQYVK